MYPIYSHNFNNKLEAQKITWVVCGCLEPYGSGSEEVRHSHLPYALMNIPKTKKLSQKFSPWNLGAWHPLAQQKWAICKSFLRKNRIFHQFVKVFSLESFPLYGIRYGVSVFSKIVLCFRAEHGYKYEWQFFFVCCGGLRVLWWLETCFHSSQILVLNTRLRQFIKINCKACDIHFRLGLFRL